VWGTSHPMTLSYRRRRWILTLTFIFVLQFLKIKQLVLDMYTRF
jgi:hypothetical protein